MPLSDKDRASLTTEEYEHLLRLARMAAARVVGRHYPELLEDATGEALVRAWKAYHDGMNVSTQAWCAKNGAIEELRKKIGKNGKKAGIYHTDTLEGTYGQGTEKDYHQDIRPEMGIADKSIEKMLSLSMDSEILNGILAWVPARPRKVLALYYGTEDMTFQKVGRALHMSDSRVYQCHNEGIKHLRTILGPLRLQNRSDSGFLETILSSAYCRRCQTVRPLTEMPRGPRGICVHCRKQSDKARSERHREYRRKKPVDRSHLQHTCCVCERTLSGNQFHLQRDRKNGLSSYCVHCYRVLRSPSDRKQGTFSGRVRVLRAAWRLAREMGLVPPVSGKTEGKSLFLISTADAVRQTSGLASHLIVNCRQIPVPLIQDWLQSSPAEFNPKRWSASTGKNLGTIERWMKKLYEASQKFYQAVSPSQKGKT